MCFYFLGFLRLLSDPPISISPLNQPTFNTKKKGREKRGGGAAAAKTSLFFENTQVSPVAAEGVKILSSGSSLLASPPPRHPEASFPLDGFLPS